MYSTRPDRVFLQQNIQYIQDCMGNLVILSVGVISVTFSLSFVRISGYRITLIYKTACNSRIWLYPHLPYKRIATNGMAPKVRVPTEDNSQPGCMSKSKKELNTRPKRMTRESSKSDDIRSPKLDKWHEGRAGNLESEHHKKKTTEWHASTENNSKMQCNYPDKGRCHNVILTKAASV